VIDAPKKEKRMEPTITVSSGASLKGTIYVALLFFYIFTIFDFYWISIRCRLVQ
jgi:hypothetical protein